MNLLEGVAEQRARARARCALACGAAHSWRDFCATGLLDLCLARAPARPGPHAAIVLEELGRSFAGASISHTIAALPALQSASGSTADFALRVLRGDTAVVLALQGIDGAWVQARPRVDGHRARNGWGLSGEAHWVPDVGSASHFVLPFDLRKQDGERTPALALVDTHSEGLRVVESSTPDGGTLSQLELDCVLVPREHVFARGPAAVRIVEDLKARLAAFHAAEMQGAAVAALEATVAHCNQREVFGQPLAALQAVRHQCADMRIALDGVSLLVAEAFWLQAAGKSFAVQASQAKAFASEKCVLVGRTAQQLHGASAFMQGHAIHRWYRHAAALSLRAGTVAEHRAVVAGAMLD